MAMYTVLAIYADNEQRFAESVEAETPEDAEEMICAQYPGLIVAGVVAGEVEVVA